MESIKIKDLIACGVHLYADWAREYDANTKTWLGVRNGAFSADPRHIDPKQPAIRVAFGDAAKGALSLPLFGEKEVYSFFLKAADVRRLIPSHVAGAELPSLTKEMLDPFIGPDRSIVKDQYGVLRTADAPTVSGVLLY